MFTCSSGAQRCYSVCSHRRLRSRDRFAVNVTHRCCSRVPAEFKPAMAACYAGESIPGTCLRRNATLFCFTTQWRWYLGVDRPYPTPSALQQVQRPQPGRTQGLLVSVREIRLCSIRREWSVAVYLPGAPIPNKTRPQRGPYPV